MGDYWCRYSNDIIYAGLKQQYHCFDINHDGQCMRFTHILVNSYIVIYDDKNLTRYKVLLNCIKHKFKESNSPR